MHKEEAQWHDYAMRIAKRWRAISPKQNMALTKFLDDLVNQRYRGPQEVVGRHPTPQERATLVRKHGLSGETAQLATDIGTFFDNFLIATLQNAKEEAMRRIKDPVLLADRLDTINNTTALLKGRPYFPLMHFGTHWVKVTNAKGETIREQAFERSGFRTAQQRQMAAFRRFSEEAKVAGFGEVVSHGVYAEETKPFFALPPLLLDSVLQQQLGLTPSQIAALQQLQYQQLPGLGFTKRFQVKWTPGYSDDFMRAFGKYAFHGARYY